MGRRSVWPGSAAELRYAAPTPSRLEWSVALFVLIIQQNAFIWLPLIMNTDPTVTMHEVESPYNSAGLLVSMLLISILSIRYLDRIVETIIRNPFVFIHMLIVLSSSLWSLYPDLTIRRGAGYVLSAYSSIYLSSAFSAKDCIRVLSQSFIISAVGSIIFTYTNPWFGIMWEPGTEGNWRGVFTHKNVLGPVMAIGLFMQLYLLAARIGPTLWHAFWIVVFFGLVWRSKSSTSFVTSLIYISMFIVYITWAKEKMAGYALAAVFILVLFGIMTALTIDPDSALGVLGKETTLTGRTELWAEVRALIDEKPLLGWGFRAMFVWGDPITNTIQERLGWTAPNAHNSFLEIALEVGLVGLVAVLIIIGTALWRALRCCWNGILPLGYFSLFYFIGILLESWTEATAIGINQDAGWLIFLTFSFFCGQALAAPERERSAH